MRVRSSIIYHLQCKSFPLAPLQSYNAKVRWARLCASGGTRTHDLPFSKRALSRLFRAPLSYRRTGAEDLALGVRLGVPAPYRTPPPVSPSGRLRQRLRHLLTADCHTADLLCCCEVERAGRAGARFLRVPRFACFTREILAALDSLRLVGVG